ncbi:MAG TPA: pilus assembly protein PilP [Rhodocyclaceae bacterium]|nr:pilus assembly protein PilP [Rhodocyclaceae bacterium]
MTYARALLALACALAMTACTSEQDDLRAWMAQQERGLKGGVKPLPEIKPFPVVDYDAEGLIEPFAGSRIEPEPRSSVGGPDLNRPREPLEAYPLESLAMVGVLMQEDRIHGLVKVDQTLHQVRVGNYMGQNHGVVTQIGDGEIAIKELVEDINGDWVERTSRLLLQER